MGCRCPGTLEYLKDLESFLEVLGKLEMIEHLHQDYAAVYSSLDGYYLAQKRFSQILDASADPHHSDLVPTQETGSTAKLLPERLLEDSSALKSDDDVAAEGPIWADFGYCPDPPFSH